MHSAGAHFTPAAIVTMIMTSTVTFLSCTCSTVQQKVRPRNFCTVFLGRDFNPRNSPSEYGPFHYMYFDVYHVKLCLTTFLLKNYHDDDNEGRTDGA